MIIKKILFVFFIALLGLSTITFASDIGGFTSPLQSVVGAMTGPVAKGFATVAIVAGGIAMALGQGAEHSGFKMFAGIAFVLGIALFATPIVASFGGAGGAVIDIIVT